MYFASRRVAFDCTRAYFRLVWVDSDVRPHDRRRVVACYLQLLGIGDKVSVLALPAVNVTEHR